MALPPTQTTTPPPSLDPSLPLAVEIEQPPTEVTEPSQAYDHESVSSTTPIVEEQTPNDHGVQQKKNNRQLDWPTLMVRFCSGAAVEIAIHASKTNVVSFRLLCMLLVLAFSAIFVAFNIANKHTNVTRVLEHVAGFLGSTAFFLAITIAFPSWLKVISWPFTHLHCLSSSSATTAN